MKRLLYICSLLFVCAQLPAQSTADGTESPRKSNWHLNSFGLSMMDGNVQFFDGYNWEILYTNARFGLPIYTDWIVFDGTVLLPEFYQFGANVGIVDTTRGLKLRIGANYAHRMDSMATTGFWINDTVAGRLASETGAFYSISVAGVKQSRELLGFLRLYGGAEFEIGLSPKSDIYFVEYQTDIGEQTIVNWNPFISEGKARFNLFASAILGLETVFFKHFGITVEVKSGLGLQTVVREKSFGMAKNSWHLGVNYYLF